MDRTTCRCIHTVRWLSGRIYNNASSQIAPVHNIHFFSEKKCLKKKWKKKAYKFVWLTELIKVMNLLTTKSDIEVFHTNLQSEAAVEWSNVIAACKNNQHLLRTSTRLLSRVDEMSPYQSLWQSHRCNVGLTRPHNTVDDGVHGQSSQTISNMQYFARLDNELHYSPKS